MTNLKDFQTFDFTNTDEAGFIVLDEGVYEAKVKEIFGRVKEETGNFVMDVDFEITKGKYEGETVRHFQSITGEKSYPFMLQMLSNMGLIRDGDRGQNNELQVKLDFGQEDDRGRTEIPAIEVNGQKRQVKGAKVVITVGTRTVDNKKRNTVERIERPENQDVGGFKNSPNMNSTSNDNQQGPPPSGFPV